eukprot:TRINITY_DN117_c4_g1_i1.p1 TRINITY_DN117_c4_g1~~TRINITY_DN117_c4_g1_i1.p1  ORF type:complete len:521 (-),score=234.35 TRINITY_DN117_c4_g1_i1:200-1762(-)
MAVEPNDANELLESGIIEYEEEIRKLQQANLGEKEAEVTSKKVGKFSTWKKKYLVLQGPCLLCYSSREEAKKPGGQPKKLILLERVSEIIDGDFEKKKKTKNNCFTLVLLSKPYQFSTSSSQEKIEWIEAIRLAVEVAKRAGQADPPLTEAEMKVVDDFRRILPRVEDREGLVPRDDVTILRFARAHRFQLPFMLGSYKENIRFRGYNNVKSITMADVYHEAQRAYAYIPGSVDRKGFKIQIFKAGLCSRSRSSVRQMMKYLFYLREKELWQRQLRDVLLVDLAGLSLNATTNFINKAYFHLLIHIFPNSSGQVILFNTPWYIRAAWNVAAPLVPQEQRNLFIFLGSNMKLLHEWVSPDALPTEYGGNFQYNHEEWIRSRLAADNVQLPTTEPQPDEHFFSDIMPANIVDSGSKSEASAQAMERNAIKVGWMTKEGGAVRNWKRRYFILNKNMLYYYKSEKESHPQGFVSLDRETEIRSDNKNKLGIEVVTGRRTYFLRTYNQQDKDDWITTLCGVCASA